MNNKIALITGATSGIGAAFAHKFASQNYDLIITGRRENKIRAVAEELKLKHNVNVEVIIAELADSADLDSLVKKIESIKNLEILINNAGFGVRNNFFEGDLIAYENMLKVHALATMKLTHAALQNMLANNKGTIINVSSICAFFPFLKNSIYVATKAFVNLFTETISQELKGTGVRVQVLCPGLTRTDFFERLGENVDELIKQRSWLWQPMPIKDVVEKSLKYLKKNKVICIPGVSNKLITILYTLRRLF